MKKKGPPEGIPFLLQEPLPPCGIDLRVRIVDGIAVPVEERSAMP